MDRKLFEINSAVRQRQIEYGNKLQELHLVVFSKQKLSLSSEKISDQTSIYPTNSKSSLFYILDSYKIGKKIIENCKLKIENSGDVVISSQDPFETGFVAYLLARKFHLPFQLQIHTDLWSPYFKNSFLNRIRLILARFLIPHAQGLRVVSATIASSLERHFHDLSVVPEVLPVFADIEKILTFQPKRDLKKDFPQFKSIILGASRLSLEKRLDVAIHSFKIVLDKFPEAGFIIAGDGPERKNLENLVKELGLSDKVVFLGWQDELISLYKTADIFLLTSEYEGYGLTLIEAGASGCPIVTTEVGIAKEEIFKTGINSYVCPVGDITCISNNISDLIFDKEKRKSFGASIQESLKKTALFKEEYVARYVKGFDNIARISVNHSRFYYVEDIIKFLTRHVLLRYLLSGGTAGLSLLASLYILNYLLGIHYLVASIMAFVVAFLVSFVLHKFWTFKSHEEKVHKQVVLYMGATLSSLGLNTFLLYIFVDHFHKQVLFSQMIVGFLVAFVTFFISRKYVFKYNK